MIRPKVGSSLSLLHAGEDSYRGHSDLIGSECRLPVNRAIRSITQLAIRRIPERSTGQLDFSFGIPRELCSLSDKHSLASARRASDNSGRRNAERENGVVRKSRCLDADLPPITSGSSETRDTLNDGRKL